MFTGIVIVKLSKPFTWESREISEVHLNFGNINGAMLNKCEREASGNLTAAMRPLSTEYTSRLASLISGVSFRAIEKMPYEDFEMLCTVVQKYLMKENPQEYYNDVVKENMGFTIPALPENPPMIEAEKTDTEKSGKNTKTS